MTAGEPHDVPSAAQLVEAVREYLERDVMAATEGRVRFHARVAVNVLAASQHATRLRFIKRGEPLPDERWPLGIVVAVLLGLLGAVMAAYLVFVAP